MVCYSRSLNLWDAVVRLEVTTLTKHKYDIRTVTFSLNGRMFASASGESARKPCPTLNLSILSILNEGLAGASGGGRDFNNEGSRGGELRLWHVATDEEMKRQRNR